MPELLSFRPFVADFLPINIGTTLGTMGVDKYILQPANRGSNTDLTVFGFPAFASPASPIQQEYIEQTDANTQFDFGNSAEQGANLTAWGPTLTSPTKNIKTTPPLNPISANNTFTYVFG